VEKALAEPIVIKRITAAAGEPFHMPIAEMTPFVKVEIARWADVVKRAGVTVQ
jgi:tripartite-type tricarboxylate transporter receptor subunit TctC